MWLCNANPIRKNANSNAREKYPTVRFTVCLICVYYL